MHKTLLNLNSIRAARDLRAGATPRKISGEYGISLANIERIETVYGNVPDNLLAGIERLLNIDSICELQEMFKGDLVAIMKNGKEVPISRRFRTQVMERLAG
jgi:hypothetical protein